MRSLALPVLAALCFLTPLRALRPTAVQKRIADTRMMAQIIIARLQVVKPQINRAPSIEIGGLVAIPKPLNITEENLGTVYRALDCLITCVYTLNISNSEQILTDMRGLKRIVKSLATAHACPSPQCESKDQLKILIKKHTAFALTIRYTVLHRLEMYLQRLIRLLGNNLSCSAASLKRSISYIF